MTAANVSADGRANERWWRNICTFRCLQRVKLDIFRDHKVRKKDRAHTFYQHAESWPGCFRRQLHACIVHAGEPSPPFCIRPVFTSASEPKIPSHHHNKRSRRERGRRNLLVQLKQGKRDSMSSLPPPCITPQNRSNPHATLTCRQLRCWGKNASAPNTHNPK